MESPATLVRTKLVAERPIMILRFLVTQIRMSVQPLNDVAFKLGSPLYGMFELTLNYCPPGDDRVYFMPSVMRLSEYSVVEGLGCPDLGKHSLGSILKFGLHYVAHVNGAHTHKVIHDEQYASLETMGLPQWPSVFYQHFPQHHADNDSGWQSHFATRLPEHSSDRATMIDLRCPGQMRGVELLSREEELQVISYRNLGKGMYVSGVSK